MTDRYERIRKALSMKPTPGPWGFTELPRDMQRDGYKFAISRRGIGWRFAQIAHEMNSMANATYITACDPDTIRELLTERDALAAEVERLAEVLRKILENEASDWKAAEEFGGYVLDDELREEARAALGMEDKRPHRRATGEHNDYSCGEERGK